MVHTANAETLTLSEWLDRLAAAGPEEAGRLGPHACDALSLGLNAYLLEGGLWDDPVRSLRAATWSSRARAVKATDAALKRAIERVEMSARGVRSGVGTREDVAQFVDAARALVQRMGAEGRRFPSYAPAAFRTANTVSVDTQHGHRVVQLAHAHVADVRSDVLVLTSSNKPGASPAGFIVESLRLRYGFTVAGDRPFLHHAQDRWSCLQPATSADQPFRHVLTLCVGDPAAGEPLSAFVETLLKGLYGAVAAMEQLGLPVGSISMPVLQAHRVSTSDGYATLVGGLIQHAVRWLKRSVATSTVNLCVYYGDELPSWAEAMDRTLGRTFVAAGQDAALDALAREVLVLARRHAEGPLSAAAGPLSDMAGRIDRVSVEQVGVEGRKLAELVLGTLFARRELKPARELANNIDTATRGGLCAPWVGAYMHTLRTLGNEGVHARLSDKVYVPNRLGRADLVTTLAAIRALLLYWDEVATT